MKTILLVGGGAESVPGIKRARELGYRTIVADGNPDCPGRNVGDAFWNISTYDPVGMVAMVRDAELLGTTIDGVLAMCTDVPVTVAYVADVFGFAGLSPERARLGADKQALRGFLASPNGARRVATPWGQPVLSAGQLRRIAASRGGPLVVKPFDSRGARGVTRVPPATPRYAFETAKAASPSARVLVEEWLDGPQISIEGVNLKDEFVVVGMLDRNYSRLEEFAPHVIEDGAEGPTRLASEDMNRLAWEFRRAARHVAGQEPCTIKGDMVLHDGRAMVIELALRLSGGYMSADLIPRMTGIDLMGIAIRMAAGDHVDRRELVPTKNRGVAIRYDIPKGCTCHPERGGHAIADAPTRDEAIDEAERLLGGKHGE